MYESVLESIAALMRIKPKDADCQLIASKMPILHSINLHLHSTQKPFITTTVPAGIAIAVWKIFQHIQPSLDTSCVSEN